MDISCIELIIFQAIWLQANLVASLSKKKKWNRRAKRNKAKQNHFSFFIFMLNV